METRADEEMAQVRRSIELMLMRRTVAPFTPAEQALYERLLGREQLLLWAVDHN